MRLAKYLCIAALFVPFSLSLSGCGEAETGQIASDDELLDYGKEAAKGTALEGFKLGGDKSEGSE